MWFFRRFEKARFPQENEKNNRATMISVKLISVALKEPRPCSPSPANTPQKFLSR
jgi:hypothetical protein